VGLDWRRASRPFIALRIISHRAPQLSPTSTFSMYALHARSHWRLLGIAKSVQKATETPQLTFLQDVHDSTESDMLFLYVSLHSPPMIALLDLPVSTSQRSSLWSRRTRRELRNLARSRIVSNLRNKQSVESDGNDDSLVATARHENFEGSSTERHEANGEWYTQDSRTMLMLDGIRPRCLRTSITANV
jgi:hypothetical protein